MGVAVLSGILDTQAAQQQQLQSGGSSSNHNVDMTSSDYEGLSLDTLPSHYYACVSRNESSKRLRSLFPQQSHPNVEILTSNNLLAAQKGDVILLGCKPNMVQDILAEDGIVEALKGKMLVSICAGLRIEQMEAWVDKSTTVVRAMPNTPSKVSSRRRSRIRRRMDLLMTLICSFYRFVRA